MTVSCSRPPSQGGPIAGADIAVARSADGGRAMASISAASPAEAAAACAALAAGPGAVAPVFAATPSLLACGGMIGDGELACATAAVAAQLPAGATQSGLYTYGEIARRGGGLGFHNQTVVVLAVQ